MAIRLKDIANDLGLSAVTISKVLRGHHDISETTRKRVLRRARDLNYQTNLTARSLATGRTRFVGLVVPDLRQPSLAAIASAISLEVEKKGYALLIAISNDNPELEVKKIRQLMARPVDVIVVVSAQASNGCFREMEEHAKPFVLVERRIEGLKANFVGVDDEAVGEMATTHLIEQGCERIAHICGPHVHTAVGRTNGYIRALRNHNLKPLPEYIVSLGIIPESLEETSGYHAAQKLLAMSPSPDAIFCFDDASAIGAMRAIFDAGLSIPKDLAVIGCGNYPYDDLLRVPLSSIDQDCGSIGKRAASLALKIAGRKRRSRSKEDFLKPRIVIRSSSLRGQWQSG